jgi:predicted DNA repair protein MutK
MSIGLLALLDDTAALIKASAASLDDIPAQISKTSSKVSGIVIDDTAVTPKYVVGLDPKRELTIIYKIAKKSLLNKLVILGPAALLLGFLIPWIITPLLMLGGAYLCFEGYEKTHSLFKPHDPSKQANMMPDVMTLEELENLRVASAVRTDFILSAEIIAITYANVAEQNLINQVIVMAAVAILITFAVYGFVALIVKTDDIGLHMAKHSRLSLLRQTGRSLVFIMPHFLMVLSYIGTAAMLWVGAEIIIHGIPFAHHGLEHLLSRLSAMPVLAWLAKVTISAISGLLFGAVIAYVLSVVKRVRKR